MSKYKIKAINPNTTLSMTDKIKQAAQLAVSADTQIIAVSPTSGGAASIEGHGDDIIAAAGVIEEIRHDKSDCDAYIVACFGDPGLMAAREATDKPVLGVAEAAMHSATFVSNGFSIVTSLARTINIARHLVLLYGMQEHCRRIRAVDMEVLALEDPSGPAFDNILRECNKALDEDESGSIVLGCSGMADLAHALTKRLGVPVIDGVSAAAGFAEAMVRMGLRTGKRNDLAFPLKKQYSGIYSFLSPGNKSPASK